MIEPNLPIVDNAPNILTQDLNKQISHNWVTKLNAVSNTYIFSLLGFKP